MKRTLRRESPQPLFHAAGSGDPPRQSAQCGLTAASVVAASCTNRRKAALAHVLDRPDPCSRGNAALLHHGAGSAACPQSPIPSDPAPEIWGIGDFC